jgi:hypothetical protein
MDLCRIHHTRRGIFVIAFGSFYFLMEGHVTVHMKGCVAPIRVFRESLQWNLAFFNHTKVMFPSYGTGVRHVNTQKPLSQSASLQHVKENHKVE